MKKSKTKTPLSTVSSSSSFFNDSALSERAPTMCLSTISNEITVKKYGIKKLVSQNKRLKKTSAADFTKYASLSEENKQLAQRNDTLC